MMFHWNEIIIVCSLIIAWFLVLTASSLYFESEGKFRIADLILCVMFASLIVLLLSVIDIIVGVMQ